MAYPPPSQTESIDARTAIWSEQMIYAKVKKLHLKLCTETA